MASSSQEVAPAKGAAQEVFSFLKTLAGIIIIVIALRGSVIEAFKIPSGSMIPTLMIGDHLLVSKLSYGFRLPFIKETLYRFGEPKRGEIVVFTRPDIPGTEEDESSKDIIKRVVAIGGDTVEIQGNKLLVNGKVAEEPYAQWSFGGISEGEFGPRQVPPGHVFLLGDNRDQSKDSRFWEDSPFLALDLIKGRALFIYFSFSDWRRMGTIIR